MNFVLEPLPSATIAEEYADHSGRASLKSRVVVSSDLPFAATAFDGSHAVSKDGALLLAEPALTFECVRAALREPRVAGVVVGDPQFPDHARKMLRESGKALVICEAPERIEPGRKYQIDGDGIVDIECLPIPISAACSYIDDLNERLYKSLNVQEIGYYRLKFCLFRLFAENPRAYFSEKAIESYLAESLEDLAARKWRKIRIVLSDPTSEELHGIGVGIEREANPEIGRRGPRVADRWWPELNAISKLVNNGSNVDVEVCVPFVSNVDEFMRVSDMVESVGISSQVTLGMTLEVPAMMYALPELMDRCPPSSIAVGTSDLIALMNGIDRNDRSLGNLPVDAISLEVVRRVCSFLGEAGVHFFVCGEMRLDRSVMRELCRYGCREMIAAASAVEIAAMNRTASEFAQPGKGK